MNEIKDVSRTPNLIAAEINNIKNETRKIMLYNSIEIGRRLVEAKQLIHHGEWSKWLQESVNYSQRTAQNLMKIFDEYAADQITLLDNNIKSQAFANLGYSQALALLELPDEEREKFVEENDINDMSTRELQKSIKEKKELEEKLKDAEKKVEEEHNAWKNVSDSYKKLEKTNEKHYKNSEELRKELEAIKDKNKESLTNKEVEIENLKIHIEEVKKQLNVAVSKGDNEEVENLQTELQSKENSLLNASKKIEELEKQLEEKAVDVTETIVEKVPEELEKELQELREKVNQSSKNNKPVVKFSIYFDELVRNFKELLEALADIEDSEQGKYKGAVSKLINKMNENL